MIRSQTARALLALALFVGFYVVAVAIALGVASIPYFEWRYANRLHFKLAAGCLVAAGLILAGLIPRREEWTDPGPRIERSDEPRLFSLISDVAAAMGQEMPREVYLLPEANAWVMHRGGFLGLGSTPVMGIGVPLLSVLTTSELKSVLAHEFGHYVGGDTRLSGVVYATRAAMGRTLENLDQNLLRKPFEWMAAGFMRITMAVGRGQELIADEWSVKLAGRERAMRALEAVGPTAIGLSVFVNEEIEPLRSAGVQPDNVFDGYRRFRHSKGWRDALPKIHESLRAEKTSPYDSHPPLADRLRHMETVADGAPGAEDEPAFSLLANAPRVEEEFSKAFRQPHLKTLPWSQIGPAWAKLQRPFAVTVQARVEGLTAERVAALASDSASVARVAERVDPSLAGYAQKDGDDRRKTTARGALGAYLAALLGENGFAFHTEPGEALTLVRGDERVEPWTLVGSMLDGSLPPASFLANLEKWGLSAEATLGAPAEELAKRGSPVWR